MIKQQQSKLVALALSVLLVAGCATKQGETDSEIVDPNAGPSTSGTSEQGIYGTDYGQEFDSGLQDNNQAALLGTTTFYFEFDSSSLRPDALVALDAHAQDLKRSGRQVVLEGHTDERGTREYNMALGERRAQAVKRYLVLQGVSSSQLEVVSYGEESPSAAGHDEQAWSLNRRVELRK